MSLLSKPKPRQRRSDFGLVDRPAENDFAVTDEVAAPVEQLDASASTQPATIFVTAFPKPGREREWEQAIGELIRKSIDFPGHLGALVLRPQGSGDRHYRVISKFDSVENMHRWHHSDERKEKVARLQTLEGKPADIHHLTGLETWFELPQHSGGDATAPPKYKMAIVVWIAVYAAV
ncbi:Antibiotic biosynthesis monooxygenase, partial [Rhodopirellula maiorica SM1]